MPLTREEYIEKYGIDPAESSQPEPLDAWPATRYVRSAVVGAAGAIPDIAAFPFAVTAGAKSAYDWAVNDKNFLDEFKKRLQVDDAQENTQKHIDEVAAQWKQDYPELTDEQIIQGINDYQKSKRFEDFTTEQLRTPFYLGAKTRDFTRRLLGDETTEEQRGWTHSAAEVIGSAAVGLPGGWVTGAGNAAARISPRAAAIATNPVARGAVRTLEAITPLTIPYSGTNVAINAGAGLAIDQTLRYAQGKSTAFTPTPEDEHGLGALAGVVGAAGATAAVVGAMRGRARQALQPSNVETALQNDPQLSFRLTPETTTGQTFLRGGDPQQLGPSSELEEGGLVRRVRRTARNQAIDESSIANAFIRDIHGGQVAREAEDLYTVNTGAVLNDRIRVDIDNTLQPIRDAWEVMDPEKQRAVGSAHWMTSYASDIQTTMDSLNTRVADLQAQIANPNTSQSAIRGLQNQVADLQTDLRRLANDDPDARLRLPHITQAQVRTHAWEFVTSADPQVVAYRNAVRATNRELLDMQVRSGKLSQQAADDLHRRNPYYVHAENDPFNELTGLRREAAKIMQSIRDRMNATSRGSAKGALRESPMRSLDREVPPPRSVGDPETRITHPMQALTSMKGYIERTLRDTYHTLPRNEYIRLLTRDRHGNPSSLVVDGRIRPKYSGANNRVWFTTAQLNSKEFSKLLEQPDIVPEWQGGQARLWEFGDPEVARALRMEPVQLAGLMKGIAAATSLMKFFTTGRGQPAFAPINAFYNMGVTLLTHKANRAFGPISYQMHKYLPASVARQVAGRIPDVTAYAAMPYYIVKNFIDLQAHYLTNVVARQLAQHAPFQALQQTVGPRVYNRMVNTALRVAAWADQAPAVVLRRHGAAYGTQSVDNPIPAIRSVFDTMKEGLHPSLRFAWRFYTDVLDSFHMADKSQYFTQNHALLLRRHGGNIPRPELDRLINETRNIAGDMSLRPASKLMADIERATPYMTQTKLGAYHLARNLFGRDTAPIVIPRLMIAMYAVGQSYYWMTHWNDESRKELWERTPEWERYRNIFIPSPTLLTAWVKGQNPPFSRDLFYKIRMPPDIAGIIAGTTAFMQMMGAIPADATAKPLSNDLPKVWIDSLTPAMPPVLQLLLAQSGARLDPATSETRGGSWIRTMGSSFRAGPNAESVTNLGEVSNTTSMMMGALFGTMGGHIAAGADVMLHAAKYNKEIGPSGELTPRQQADYAEGLRKATGKVAERITAKLPDVPLLWQGKENYMTMTPAWTEMAVNEQHIRSIVGMRNDLVGKAAAARREAAASVGGVPEKVLSDITLGQIAEDIAGWNRPTGDLGKLKKEYNDIRVKSRAIDAQYNMPQDQRMQQKNELIKQMQDNKKQQTRATMWAEQVIADKYGDALAPLLRGRFINMPTLDAMMRENVGAAATQGSEQEQPQQ